MVGIGHAILNRVDLKGRFGFAKTPCSVVLQSAQFEPLAKGKWEYRIVKAARQGNTSYEPKTDNPIDSRAFKRAKHLARQIIYGGIPDNTGGATNFYAPKVMYKRGDATPNWAEKYPFTVQIGGHHYHKAVYFHTTNNGDT
jgi:spore germination cell wall hydrolase CwlJ-like protein